MRIPPTAISYTGLGGGAKTATIQGAKQFHNQKHARRSGQHTANTDAEQPCQTLPISAAIIIAEYRRHPDGKTGKKRLKQILRIYQQCDGGHTVFPFHAHHQDIEHRSGNRGGKIGQHFRSTITAAAPQYVPCASRLHKVKRPPAPRKYTTPATAGIE